MHDGSVGIADGEGMSSYNLIVNGRTGSEEMSSAAGVSNGTTVMR